MLFQARVFNFDMPKVGSEGLDRDLTSKAAEVLRVLSTALFAVSDSTVNKKLFKELFRLFVAFFIHSNGFSFAYWI